MTDTEGTSLYPKSEWIEKRFTYHAPDEQQTARYQAIRDEAKRFAYLIWDTCELNDEALKAVEKLDETVFWANASIARGAEI